MNSTSRRRFVQSSALTALAVMSPISSQPVFAYPRPDKNAISLATWSLVCSYQAEVWKLTDIARICHEDLGLNGIEYVNTFFENPIEPYLQKLNQNAKDHGVRNVLIMIDDEGDMIAKEKSVRMQAAINHRKWVEIAAVLGCHAIRCNARGGGNTRADDPDAIDRAAEAFSALLEYAKEFQINIMIENHGGLSSDPHWLPELMKKVNNPNFGILPDYGNYNLPKQEDREEAVRLAMPFAKGVSVKADWLPDGTHPNYDLAKMLTISKESGYTGFWGIESGMRRKRADGLPSKEEIKKDDYQAVLWTKKIVEKVVFGKE